MKYQIPYVSSGLVARSPSCSSHIQPYEMARATSSRFDAGYRSSGRLGALLHG